MIERYSREEMIAIWTEQAQFDAWLDVELAACWAWSQIGVIPQKDVDTLYRKASFSLERIKEIEEQTRHDVVDTAWGVRLKKANQILRNDLHRMIDVLKNKALNYKHTMMMGRTHGIHAEPTTFGLKCALWYAEMQRNLERFEQAADAVEFGKLSGSVGTFANIPPEVETHTCEKLGLKPAPISTQTLQRDRHAHYVSTLALIGSSLEKMAVEVRHLQRSEVREVEEAFRKGQKGSSSMPHKRNPISSENITGCARVLRGYMLTAFENISLWHERDISHSSAERIILPDATMLLDYMLHRFANVMENLVVFEDNMESNIWKTHGLVFSQRVLNKLIDQGMVREQAYDAVQPLAMRAWQEQIPFKPLVQEDPVISRQLSSELIDELFDLAHHSKQVDQIFARVGLD